MPSSFWLEPPEMYALIKAAKLTETPMYVSLSPHHRKNKIKGFKDPRLQPHTHTQHSHWVGDFKPVHPNKQTNSNLSVYKEKQGESSG